MTTQQQILSAIGGEPTLKLVKELDTSTYEHKNFEMYDITFRLIKKNRNINLEIAAQISTGLSSTHDERVSFFKVISFYEKVDNEFKVTVLNEFESEYNKLSPILKLCPAKKLTISENAVIAAFSKEALYAALKKKDTSTLINGFKVDFLMSFAGLPQSFLDDKHGLSGPIGVYEFNGNNGEARPMVQYKATFDKFASMGLFTMFNR